ncbi:tetratricopeptide repeat protein [Truepera radiovictrix]|uniref:Transcriptional regulator, SARP family n=1 Tax=Truepera radiovictrix (strain DSM 17093 / CIP 108686 / LMG 22925 / RQ-24) TaxID=649638 RepID=D7CUS5_TRURR|nr:tetratricopeptide repeat protein [Truepera radiovictrix]ADI14066.1 transcriptional regulator, SARP family [Truepera radiovictrix DSM 17093]WMT57372.1 tetratricopeptide repeat protein [Truepera radiovictrix]
MQPGPLLTLLGAPALWWQGQEVVLQPKQLALLIYVALEGPCPRADLTELLWGPGRGANLRTALYKLRGLPGAEGWLRDGDLVGVAVATDVAALERACREGRFADALSHLARGETFALGLLAPSAAFEEWLEERRRETSELVRETLRGAAQENRERGAYAQAKAYAERLLARDPLDEASYRLLMRLEHESGDPEAVRSTFERLRTALAEVGGEPAPETLKLRGQLLGADGAGAQGTLLRPGDRVPGRAAGLVGRAELLERLSDAVRTGPTLLHGFGGVGKTALAAEFAAVQLESGPVLWLQAGRSDAPELVDALQRALGLQGNPSASALGAALARERVSLLVVDDVWNGDAVRALRGLLPETLPLLSTSRGRVAGFKRLEVGVLARPDARALLTEVAGVPLPEAEADQICHVLGDHPFALRLAGTQLQKLSVSQLLARLANAPHTLHAPRSWDESESISALLSSSLEGLTDDAYEAFLAVGALASGSVTPELLAHLLRRDTETAEAALAELHAQALAERVARPGSDTVRYALHDLSYSFARQNRALRPQTVVRACSRFVAEHARAFELLDAEIGNLIGALEVAYALGYRAALVDLTANLVVGDAYFSARGHSPRSLKLLEVAVSWAKELGQLERAHHLAGRLGDAHREQYHQFEKALEAYQEGARLARLIRNPSREAILTSICGIAHHYLGQPSDVAFERAYQLAEQANDGLALGQVLQHRGYVAWTSQDWKAMERFNQEALQVARSLHQVRHIDQSRVDYNLFSALLNLGEAKRKLGSFEEAVALRLEALQIANTRQNQLWQAHALQELGEMYSDEQRSVEARSYLLEALALYEANDVQARIQQVQKMLGSLELMELTSS